MPAPPQRIVAIDGRNDLDALLTLGVTPAAAFNRFSTEPDTEAATAAFYGDRLDGVTILDDGYNLETVAAAQPDLILGQNIGDTYPSLARIAPTVSITFAAWRATTRMIGRATGADEAADRYISQFDARIAELAAPPGTRPSVAIIDVRDTGSFRVRNDCNAHRLLLDLGFTTALGPADTFTEYSAERLGELDTADRLIVLRFGGNEAPDAFVASELFTQLRPVRDGGFQVIGPDAAGTWYFPTALSAPACLDDIVRLLPELT